MRTTFWECMEGELPVIQSALGEKYSVDRGSHTSRSVQIYDSFDCNLIDKGRALIRSQGRFRLVDAEDLISNEVVSDRVVRHQRPVFWWDFPAGEFQSELKSYLKLRAAQPFATVVFICQQLNVRNEDGKIVLRLLQERGSLEEREEARITLQIRPLEGYDHEAEEISGLLSSQTGLESVSTRLIDTILQWSEKSERPLSPKSMIDLRGDQSVHAAVTHIAQEMMKVVRQNEQGIIDDIDSEFLHDYRVAIRKLRSVITLIKGAYPPAETKWLKKEFGNLARETNRHRDLDVYLLEEGAYRSQLPAFLAPGLDRVFKDFRAERSRVKGCTSRRLASKAYREHLASLEDWWRNANLPRGKYADLEMGEVVRKELLKHFKHVQKFGRSLNENTEDEEVHALRIECKKLRYLLELFSSLMAPKPLKQILKRMKGLQNVLGEFNDCAVQKENMQTYLQKVHQPDRQCAAALGGLIVVLAAKQLEARSHVQERFAEFCDGKMMIRFEALFGEENQ
ncbi:CHAD domain-containing protein [Kiritimatiellaeota bacterium B1221]|nr:CHAD domain-containing protein [Kiritimatiellaeota bacterium B1221]